MTRRDPPEKLFLSWLAAHFGGKTMDDVQAIIEQRAKLDASLDQAIADLEQDIADKTAKLAEARAARGVIASREPDKKTRKCRVCKKQYTGKRCPCRKQADPPAPTEGDQACQE